MGVAVLRALLRRFPKLHTPASYPVIPLDRELEFPSLRDDFATIRTELDPVFTKFDEEALRLQNRYRWQHVLLLFGTAALTSLGGLQAVFPAQRWPTILLACLGIAMALSAGFAKESTSLQEFLTARVKAERLRSLYFLFLSRTGLFGGDDPATALRYAVAAVEAGEDFQ